MIKNQRRVFRGRGGPTDRRLPKHNARRRQQPTRHPEAESEASFSTSLPVSSSSADAHPINTDIDTKDTPLQSKTPLTDEPQVVETEHASERELTGSEESGQWDNDLWIVGDEPARVRTGVSMKSLKVMEKDEGVAVVDDDAPVGLTTITAPERQGEEDSAFQIELDHLLKRIENNRQAMQLSKSLAVPSNYQKHVLDAVHNTVREWKSIQKHYHHGDRPIKDDDVVSDQQQGQQQQKAAVALAVFQLVQQALQCGPLSGSKPGYMKRCGSDVAQRVLDFLETTFPIQREECVFTLIGWTEKQAKAIDTWKKNARAAKEK